MTKSKTTSVTYENLKSELDDVLLELQREDLDVDMAVKLYQRGLELIQQLETYLATAENTVQQIKAKFSGTKT